MTKQEKIREGIKGLIRMYNPTVSDDKADWEAGLYLSYLHSQGVVIKVGEIEEITTTASQPETFQDIGYVAVKPLIKEEN